jgi:hypothetical protein
VACLKMGDMASTMGPIKEGATASSTTSRGQAPAALMTAAPQIRWVQEEVRLKTYRSLRCVQEA